MKTRTEQQFLKIIREAHVKAPMEPVRIDIRPEELKAVRGALMQLVCSSNRMQAWRCIETAHPTDPDRLRVAFIAPSARGPVECVAVPKQKTPAAYLKAAEALRGKMQAQHPDQIVEIRMHGPSGGPPCIEVWDPEAWSTVALAAFTAAEIARRARSFESAVMAIDHMRPLARQAKAQRARCKAIQAKGVAERQHQARRQRDFIRNRAATFHGMLAKERDFELIAALRNEFPDLDSRTDSALQSVVHRALGLKR